MGEKRAAGNNKNNYNSRKRKRYALSVSCARGSPVLLFTCDSNREKPATKEIMNLIGDYVESLFDQPDLDPKSSKADIEGGSSLDVDTPMDKQASNSSGPASIADLFEAELASLRSSTKRHHHDGHGHNNGHNHGNGNQDGNEDGNGDDADNNDDKSGTGAGGKLTQRFVSIDLNTRGMGMVWFRDRSIDPVQIVDQLFQDVTDTGQMYTKHTVRLFPLQYTCYASLESVMELFRPVAVDFLSALNTGQLPWKPPVIPRNNDKQEEGNNGKDRNDDDRNGGVSTSKDGPATVAASDSPASGENAYANAANKSLPMATTTSTEATATATDEKPSDPTTSPIPPAPGTAKPKPKPTSAARTAPPTTNAPSDSTPQASTLAGTNAGTATGNSTRNSAGGGGCGGGGSGTGRPTTYGIVLSRRNNKDFPRDDLLHRVASVLVPAGLRVDLLNPDYVILVQVFQNLAGFAIVQNRGKGCGRSSEGMGEGEGKGEKVEKEATEKEEIEGEEKESNEEKEGKKKGAAEEDGGNDKDGTEGAKKKCREGNKGGNGGGSVLVGATAVARNVMKEKGYNLRQFGERIAAARQQQQQQKKQGTGEK